MRLFLLFAFGFLILTCSSDEEETIVDLTMDIVGEYQGTYSSEVEDGVDDFEVTVIKIDDDTVEILPSDGNSFLEVTVDLMSSSETLITNQPNQQYGTTTTFNVDEPTTLIFTIDPTGFEAKFNGTKL